MTKELVDEALGIIDAAIPRSVAGVIKALKIIPMRGDLEDDIPIFFATDYLTAYLKKYGEIDIQLDAAGQLIDEDGGGA